MRARVWLSGLLVAAGTWQAVGQVAEKAAPNTLTAGEQQAGWRLLWDGKTTEGWRSLKSEQFPAKGWSVTNGTLTVHGEAGKAGTGGGDIVTVKSYARFELRLEFQITPGANSGIKYFVERDLTKTKGAGLGLEYQILDDERHPDAKLGRDGNRTMASLYDLIPAAAGKPVNPPNAWNEARLVARGTHVEHWLNGVKVLEYERGSADFRKIVAQSKFKSWAAFGELPEGPILLQDHGNTVHYRSIKLRELPAE